MENTSVENQIKSKPNTHDGCDEVMDIIMDEVSSINRNLMEYLQGYYERDFKYDLLSRLEDRGVKIDTHIKWVGEGVINPYLDDETTQSMIDSVKIIY